MLSDDEQRRYARHILLEEIGLTGQERLSRAHVLMIGAGGLGASALSYLAACGVGTITIMDDDKVELSNLNRQIIHETADIGRYKVDSAADRISELNPNVDVKPLKMRFDKAGQSYVRNADLVLDGTDNFATRYAINAVCKASLTPWMYSALRGFDAQFSLFTHTPDAPCYQCLVPHEPSGRHSCEERGVFGALVGVAGSIIAVEAIKNLLGIGESYAGKLVRYNALSGMWRSATFSRDPACPTCGIPT